MPETGSDKELENLGKRITEARIEAGLVPEAQPDASPVSGRGMQAGFELAVAVIACTFLGLGLDRWLKTAPLFMLLGLCLGFAAGMWSLYRASMGASDYKVGLNKKDE